MRRTRLLSSSGPILIDSPAKRQTPITTKIHRSARRGEYVGLKEKIAGMPLITAIRPRLTRRHQNVDWRILMGMSGRAAPNAKNTMISAIQIDAMIATSRRNRRGRTGFRLPASWSINESNDILCLYLRRTVAYGATPCHDLITKLISGVVAG